MSRPAIRWTVLITVGLAASWIVAWACALWAPRRSTRSLAEVEARAVLLGALGEVTGDGPAAGTTDAGPGWSLTTAAIVEHPGRRAQQSRGAPLRRNPQAGSGVRFQQVPASEHDRTVTIFRAGWPVACFWGTTQTSGATRRSQGLLHPPALIDALGVKPMRKIPWRPSPAGFVVNTAFFGSVLWLAGPGQMAWRRAWRRRRGLCPQCSYDLTHTAGGDCPECGAAPA